MGLFGGGGKEKEQEQQERKPTVSIISNPTLPSKDIAEIVTDNKQIPEAVRARHWSRDVQSVALSKLTYEERRRLTAQAAIREDIRQLYEQQVFIYVPGVDLVREASDLDYELPFRFAMSKADNENDSPLIDKLLSSSTLVETRQGETKNKEKEGGRRKLLGII